MPLHFLRVADRLRQKEQSRPYIPSSHKTLWLVTALQGAAPLPCASLSLYTHCSSTACPGQTGGELRCCSLDDTESVL